MAKKLLIRGALQNVSLSDIQGCCSRIPRETPEDAQRHGTAEHPLGEMLCASLGMVHADADRSLMEADVYSVNGCGVHGLYLPCGVSTFVCYDADLAALEEMVVTEQAWRDEETAYNLFYKRLTKVVDTTMRVTGKAAGTGHYQWLDEAGALQVARFGQTPQGIMEELGLTSWNGRKFRRLTRLGPYERRKSIERHERERADDMSAFMRRAEQRDQQLTSALELLTQLLGGQAGAGTASTKK